MAVKAKLPTFFIFNLVYRGSEDVYNMDWYRLFRIDVSYDGTTSWEPGGTFISKCKIDVTFYPFDDQVANSQKKIIFFNLHDNC